MPVCDKRADTVLASIYLNPTRYCNLRCRHCWVSPPYTEKLSEESGELSIDEMIGIVREALPLGLANLKLTGGEPLLRAGIERLLEFCASQGITVWIETNGTLVTAKMARMFRELGVDDISVSLDSPREERHDLFRGKKGAFKSTVEGIRNLTAAGMFPEAILSLYRENISSFGEFLELVTGLGIKRVKINKISPVGRGKGLCDAEILPDVKETLDFYEEIRSRYAGFDGLIYLDIPVAFKGLDDIKNGRCGVCGVKNILGILSDGTVSICGIGIVDKELVFGNVKGNPGSIGSIWRGARELNRLREEVPSRLEGVCGKCVFRNICLGDCRAEVFHNTGSFTAPSRFCQEAYEKGLFPATRLMPSTTKA